MALASEFPPWAGRTGAALVLVASLAAAPGAACLDATDASSANGTRLQIWQCHGGVNQTWQLPS